MPLPLIPIRAAALGALMAWAAEGGVGASS